VLVLGARLNWILHFGQAPKWNSRARIAQVDINADVIGQNAGNDELGVVADVSVFIQRLLPQLGSWRYSENTPFRNLLAQEQDKNAKILAKAAQLETLPLTFERAYHVIRTTLDSLSPPQDGGIVYVSEGARTSE
jgi:2-hydroxyacyl-CoA lyase 1